MYDMFYGCESLQTLKTPKIVIEEIELPHEMYNENNELCNTIQIANKSITYTKEKVKEIISNILDTVEKECKISTILGSSFSVEIPLAITPVTEHGVGIANYNITIKGDIPGSKKVEVLPDNTFSLSADGKEDAIGHIVQNNTEFSYDMIDDNGYVEQGTITIEGLSSGTWNGSFAFTISLINS